VTQAAGGYTPSVAIRLGILQVDAEALGAVCRVWRIRRLAVFGSVLRDDFTPDSDVDVLIEFDPGAAVGYFGLYDLEQELAPLFGGRTLDIGTFRSLSKWIREDVLSQAVVLYDEE